ncbi:MAG TPA: SLC13 family permease [Bryobacteraceae bacterium]|nr:SLC13 family permease [Bryobacteraceae bacterium]
MADAPVAQIEVAAASPVAESAGGLAKSIGWLASVAIPVAMWFAPLPLAATSKHAIAITLFMIVAWAFEVLDHGLTGLIGCYLFWALGVVKVDVAFSGFADDTPWFVLGAMLFGTMASRSGLARRMAYTVMARIGTTYSRVLLGLIISDFLLTFLVPSGPPRAIIMSTVALGLVEAFGLGKGSNVGRGMFLIVTYTASVFDKTVIAGAASIIARGAIERFGHVQVLYSKWLLAYLPSDVVMILVAWRLMLWFYPPEKDSLPGGSSFLKNELVKMGPWTPLEKKSLALMLVAIGLWTTDFLHHIPSSVIGLGIGLIALMPVLRVLGIEDLKRVNYLVFLFIGAAISMGRVLTATKSLDVLTNVLFGWMTPLLGNAFLSTIVTYWTAFTYHIFLASELSMLGTSVPVLMNYATAHHLSPLALGMVWTFASTGKIFLYQSAVLMVGYSFGYFRSKDLFRLGFCMSIVDSVLLLFVVPLYWPLLGIAM